jgi:hypothetical protein
MAPKIAELREMSDDDVIRTHDSEVAGNRGVDSSFYLDEQRRRQAQRAEEAAYELARSSHELAARAYDLASRTYWLAIAAAMFAAASTIAAIIGLVWPPAALSRSAAPWSHRRR